MKKNNVVILLIFCIGILQTTPTVFGETAKVPSAVLIRSSLTRIYSIQASNTIQEQILPSVSLDDNSGLVLELTSSIGLTVDIKRGDEVVADRIQVLPNQKQIVNLTSWIEKKTILRASIVVYPRNSEVTIIASLTVFQTVFDKHSVSDEPSKIRIPVVKGKTTLEEALYAIVVPAAQQRIYLNIIVNPLPKALILNDTAINRSIDGIYRTSILEKEFMVKVRVLGQPVKFDVIASIVFASHASSSRKFSDTVFASLLSIMLFVAPLAIRHTALKKAEARRIQESSNKRSRGA